MAKRRGKSRSKFAFDYKAMDDLIEKLDRAGGNLPDAVDRTLKAAHGYITPGLKSGIARHHASGDTEKSLQTSGEVVWDTPLRAHIRIGFKISDGGLPSIFLMWGTPKHGAHPGTAADAKLKNAAFGAKVKREVAAIQREEFEKAIQEASRG